MGSQEKEFAHCEIERWLSHGYVRRASPEETRNLTQQGQIFPAFVSNTAGKHRLVVDYKRANECMETRSFRMDQISDLAAVLRPRDNLFKADVKDAYYHMRLRPVDQLRLAFCVGVDVYIPFCMNCGLSVAPWFFTKLMRPVVFLLRRLGHRVFAYLDDFYGAAKPATGTRHASRADSLQLGRLMRILFSKLGLHLHPEKCFFEDSTSLEILGIVVDTNRRQFLLSPHKLARVEKAARRLLSHVTRHRRRVLIKDLRRFTGIANATGPAVTDARLRLREMFDALSLASRVTPTIENIENTTQSPPSHNVTCHASRETSFVEAKRYRRHTPVTQERLSHAAVRDLLWCARLSQNSHFGRHIWPHPEACIFTDASMGGWGAAWNGSVPASGFLGPEQEGSHINELEVTAALLALNNFIAYARNRHVQLITDSLVTAHIVRNMTSRSPRLLSKLRELRQLCETHGVTLSTRHLPSVLNCWANRLSRRRDSHAWQLPFEARLLLERRFRMRLQLVDGHGLPDRRPTIHPPLVLPRPSLLGVWARHFAQRGSGVLLAPVWPGQQWFQEALRAAQCTPLRNTLTPPWGTCAFQFKTRPRPFPGVSKAQTGLHYF